MDSSDLSNSKMQSDSSKSSEDFEAQKLDLEQANLTGGTEFRGSELMRTVTQYTEYSVTTGAALGNKIREDEGEPVKPPTNTHGLFSKNGIFNLKFLNQYSTIILIMVTFIFSVFSIYWGSMFGRSERLVNLKVLVAVENNQDNPISRALVDATRTSPVNRLAGWVIKDNLTEEEVIYKVHEEHYWGSIYVTASDISTGLTDALSNGEYFNTTDLVKSYYEAGRDPNGMNSYVIPALKQLALVYEKVIQQQIYPSLLSNLTSDQLSKARDNDMLTAIPSVTFTDGRPMTEPVIMASLQVGLIYIIILTFFQVMWFGKLHGDVAKVLNPKSYMLYRMIAAQVAFLFLSLALTAVNAAFQISMNKSWKGGFGVLWMIHFLTMSAVGGANENMALICFATIQPLMGCWMLFFVVINISATFSPIEVCPGLFRFTYAMPIKNAYEWMKMLFFDTTRRHLGRYIGILIAWIVINNILLPFCLMFFGYMSKKRIAAMAKQIESKD